MNEAVQLYQIDIEPYYLFSNNAYNLSNDHNSQTRSELNMSATDLVDDSC